MAGFHRFEHRAAPTALLAGEECRHSAALPSLPDTMVELAATLAGIAGRHCRRAERRRPALLSPGRHGLKAAVGRLPAPSSGSRMVKTAPVRSTRFARDDRTALRLDEAAADRETETGPRAPAGRPPARDRICRRCARARPPGCRRPRRRWPGTTPSPSGLRGDAHGRARRRVFGRVCRAGLNTTLLEQHENRGAASAGRGRGRS